MLANIFNSTKISMKISQMITFLMDFEEALLNFPAICVFEKLKKCILALR